MVYIGYWFSGTSSNVDPRKDTNIKKLRAHLRYVARGNRTSPTMSAGYTIYYLDNGKGVQEDGAYIRGKWNVVTYEV